MKFLLRFVLVLAVAVALGAVLYFAVQTLLNGLPNPRPTVSLTPQSGNNTPENAASRPERDEDDRGGSSPWRLILGLARRIIMFSVLVFAALLGRNFIFERKPAKKKTRD